MQTTTIMIRAALALLLCLACASALVQGSPPGPPATPEPILADAPASVALPSAPVCFYVAQPAGESVASL